MARLGGADEIVIREIQTRRQVTEILADGIGEGLRRETLVIRRLFDLLPMFVRAGKEHHLISVQPLEPGQHVTGQGRIGMADMRLVIHVINRRGNVVTLLI